jgi:hypothetical protein
MFDLIELTQTEVALQDMSFTLKEIADKFGKGKKDDHSDMKKSFDRMVKSLGEKKRNILLGNISELSYTQDLGNGATRQNKTYKMSFFATLWFTSQFEHGLRFDVIAYAMTKLDDERKELVLTIQENEEKFLKETKKLQNKIHDISVKKFNHHDGFQTVSRLVHELALDFTVSDIMDDLTDRGIVETLKVVKKLRKPLCPKLTRRGSHGELLVSEEFIKNTYTNIDTE